MVTSRHIATLIAIALLCAGAAPASATKLDDVTCDALKLERARIETESLKSDMEKGPEWAKDNLSSVRLKEIEQLIGLQESIAFRCPLPKPPPPDPNNPAAVTQPGQAAPDKQPSPAAEDQAENDTFSLTPGLSPGLTQSPRAALKKTLPATIPENAPPSNDSKPAAAAATQATKTKAGATPNAATADAARPAVSKKPKATDAYVPPPRMGLSPEEQESPELAPVPSPAQ